MKQMQNLFVQNLKKMIYLFSISNPLASNKEFSKPMVHNCFMEILLKYFLPFIVSITFANADTISDERLQTYRQNLPSNNLMTKVMDSCPMIVSNALLFDVRKQFNSTQYVPLSVFIDVFRLAEVDDLTRR